MHLIGWRPIHATHAIDSFKVVSDYPAFADAVGAMQPPPPDGGAGGGEFDTDEERQRQIQQLLAAEEERRAKLPPVPDNITYVLYVGF